MAGINDRTGDDETHRYLNTKTKEGYHASGMAHQGQVSEETGGSGGHDQKDLTYFMYFNFSNSATLNVSITGLLHLPGINIC